MNVGRSRSDRLSNLLVIAASLVIVAFVLEMLERRHIEQSERSEQENPAGESVETEWAKESFPASDPPQSW